MSDFKTNEYANLVGGKQFEPKEEKSYAWVQRRIPLLQRFYIKKAFALNVPPLKKYGKKWD